MPRAKGCQVLCNVKQVPGVAPPALNYPRAIGPGNGSLAGKLCYTILSSLRSSMAVVRSSTSWAQNAGRSSGFLLVNSF